MKNFTKIVTLFACLMMLNNVKAATITAAATGSWTATTTWVGGVVPTTGDNVIIPAGKVVTYSFGSSSFVNPATISISGTIIFDGLNPIIVVIFQNAITLTVESGGVFTDNNSEGGYNFNGKVSSFIFKTGSSLTVGSKNTFGDIYVRAVSGAAPTTANSTFVATTTPKPFTISSNGTTTVLPLTLQSFVAYTQNTAVNLVWQTTNEVNVSHIYVERSTDGTSFTRINKLNTKGDGTYTYSDDVAALSSSKLYYRLVIVDKDGSAAYSKVVSAQLSSSAVTQLSFYPNPVKDNLFVQFTSTKQEKVSLKIINLKGQVVHEETLQATIGNISTTVNTSILANGSYVLQVKGSNTMLQKQFVK